MESFFGFPGLPKLISTGDSKVPRAGFCLDDCKYLQKMSAFSDFGWWQNLGVLADCFCLMK